MAKREKESKISLKVWVPILCIIVVGITFYMIHDIQSKVEEMNVKNTTNAEQNKNEEPKNEAELIENEVEENLVQNQVAQVPKNTTNTAQNTSNPKNTSQNQSSITTQPGITDQKQKAIELVKKELQDNSVNYVFDYVNENGEYVIAVKDKNSATVKYYFRVNLETETVELD